MLPISMARSNSYRKIGRHRSIPLFAFNAPGNDDDNGQYHAYEEDDRIDDDPHQRYTHYQSKGKRPVATGATGTKCLCRSRSQRTHRLLLLKLAWFL